MIEYKAFQDIVEDLGYDHLMPLYEPKPFLESDALYDCGDGCILKITTFIKPWWNKLNYLNGMYIALTQDRPVESNEELERLLSITAENIRMDEWSNVVEVGWKVMYNKHPDDYPREGRRRALFEFMVRTRQHLSEGMFGMQPFPNIVLTARPMGPKLDWGFTEESIERGIEARAHFAQRFGFGELKDDGFCYAIYDEDLKLQPL